MKRFVLHTEEFKDFINQEVKSASINIFVNNALVPVKKRKVRIVNYGRLVGVYESHYSWYARLETSAGRYRRIGLTTFGLEEAKEVLKNWSGELSFCTHLLEKHGFESIGLGNFYCIGKSDLEITLKMQDKYESFKKYRIDTAMEILRRYE